MLHVALEVDAEEAPRAAYLLAKFGVFTPERSVLSHYSAANFAGQLYQEVTEQARAKLNHLAAHYQTLPAAAAQPSEPPTLAQLEEVNVWLDELLQVTDACRAKHEQFEREQRHEADLLNELAPFKTLDVDLKVLARPKKFLQTLVGSVAESDLADLTAQLAHVGGIVEIFGRQAGRAYLVVICPQLQCTVSQRLLLQHGWHEIQLPAEFSGRPQEIEANLDALATRISQGVADLAQAHQHTFAHIKDPLAHAVKMIELAEPYAHLVDDTVTEASGQLLIRGWIPQRNLPRLQRHLATLTGKYHLETRPPQPGERESVPSARRYPVWMGPFAELVRGYGVPCYGDFDPTLFFSISFIVMFGMMFGDVGHGLMIGLAALFLRGEARRFRPIMLAAGGSASGFGWLYGSVFGLEHVLQPLWIAPLSDPERMLAMALWWGVGFLVSTQLIMLYNRLVARHWRAALLDAGGVAGLLLYLGGVMALYLGYQAKAGAGLALAVALIGFVLILLQHCMQLREPWPGRFFLGLMDSLETVFNDFVNTVSFMRLAAFSISHVALAMAITTLSAEMGQAGQIIALVFGNILILVLEGAIVAIQALRLEYYEGFSRYFTCFGREFKPILDARVPKTPII